MRAVGKEVPITWRGRRVRAFVPTLLSERDLMLDAPTAAKAGAARAVVEHSAEAMPDDYPPLARLLLRAEGLASSYVEGVAAPVVDVVIAESSDGTRSTAAWVASNLAAMTEALVDAERGRGFTTAKLCRWHRTLMAGSPTPSDHVGAIRNEQGWIGGTSPLDAHLVTAPPDRLPNLLDDLVAYVNRADLDPIAQAAIAHAQLEVIHPFADGNGRIGRVLVAWMLVRHLRLVTPPPVSTAIAADVGGYASGLVLFRMGEHGRWVRWFADAVSGAGRAQWDLIVAVDDLRLAWRERLGEPRPGVRRLRSNASAWRVLDLVPRHLVLSSALVAGELDLPAKTATAALHELVAAGVLVEHPPVSGARGRPAQLYVSTELLGLVGSTPRR